jgi:nucleoid DNA-binding protein
MAVKKKAAPKTAKKAAAKAAPKAAAAKPVKAIANKQTKVQIITAIAETTNLSKKDVTAVFSALGDMITSHIKKRGSGEFSIPETGVKIRRVVKPARKARMGRNPATGEPMKIAAKKASTVVKVTALKALKDKIGA